MDIWVFKNRYANRIMDFVIGIGFGSLLQFSFITQFSTPLGIVGNISLICAAVYIAARITEPLWIKKVEKYK